MFNNRKVAGKADSVKLQDVPPQKPRKLAQQPKLYYISLYTCLPLRTYARAYSGFQKLKK